MNIMFYVRMTLTLGFEIKVFILLQNTNMKPPLKKGTHVLYILCFVMYALTFLKSYRVSSTVHDYL